VLHAVCLAFSIIKIYSWLRTNCKALAIHICVSIYKSIYNIAVHILHVYILETLIAKVGYFLEVLI